MDYFVSYRFTGGFGRCYVKRDSRVTCMDDIFDMEEAILKLKQETDPSWNSNTRPVIVGWQPFEKPA